MGRFIPRDAEGWSDVTGTKLVDGHDVDFVVDLIVVDHTVAELREITSDLGVSRKRGDNKRETASRIAYQAEDDIRVVDVGDGIKEVRFDR